MATFSTSALGKNISDLVNNPTQFTSGLKDREVGWLKQGILCAANSMGLDGQENTSKTVAATVTNSSCVISIT